MMNKGLIKITVILLAVVMIAGCGRGRTSSKPPVHLNPNMDTQQKIKPFRESNFFADGMGMRQPVEGTIAKGDLRENTEFYTGKNENGEFLKNSPVAVDNKILDRGMERYNIYCSPCHGQVGDGKGIITKYAYPIPPTNLHDPRIRSVEDGYLYDVITNGIRNMPAYNHQIPVSDRWAIVGYIRSLQLSQKAINNNLPENHSAGISR